MKREIPLAVTFLAGLAMIVQFYAPPLGALGDTFTEWFTIISTFGYVLGAGSLLVVNLHKIQRQGPGWGYNLLLLVSLVATLVMGGIWPFNLWMAPPGHLPVDEGTPFNWTFQYVFTPLSATTFSLLAFFIASASFRAFKARSVEATLLLGTAFLVILFRVPLGEMLWNHLPLLGQYDIGRIVEDWVMGGFNAAGQRSIMLGAAVGLISVSLKILLGIERSYLGGAD